jgi:predicted nucleotidyltransferase
MSRLAAALDGTVRALERGGARGALVGGLAVSARSEPRFTRDVDLAVAVESDEDAERLVRFLAGEGFLVTALVEQTAAARLATVRLRPPGEPDDAGVVVDLLFASSGIERELVEAAEPIEVFAGVWVPVARIGHLVALKLLARDDANRPQDATDLRALTPMLDERERGLARAAVRAIRERGFARGRDLEAALDELLATR